MNKVIPINEEYKYENKVMISQSDLNGTIVFVNRKFSEVSGYSVDELIGSSRDIITHPQMPETLLVKMLESIKNGRSWNGLIKNLRKDGLYYWVDMEILPTYDDNNKLTGYISVGKAASRKDIQENEEIYKKMLNIK